MSNAPTMGKSRVSWYKDILAKYDRIAITGTPRGGKTTLSKWSDRTVVHTDDFKNKEWSEASQAIVDKCNKLQGKFVVEGVRVPHALRKGMLIDVVILLVDPLQILTSRQRGMANSVKTIMDQWHSSNTDVPILIAPAIPNDHRRDHIGYHEEEE